MPIHPAHPGGLSQSLVPAKTRRKTEVPTQANPEDSLQLSNSPAPCRLSVAQTQSQQALANLVIAPTLDPLVRQVLLSDLAQFPPAWLDFLDRSGVRVVVLGPNQTLADSPWMQRHAVSDLSDQCHNLKSTLATALAQVPTPEDEFQAHMQRKALADNVHQWLGEGPFRLAVHNQPVDLDDLAQQRQLPEDYRAEWKALLLQLNEPWTRLQEGRLHSDFGFFVLPPVLTAHGPIPDARYQEAYSTSAEWVASNLGLNRSSDRLVLLHERYLASDAPEIGGWRVAIHEVGHALDHLLEGLPEETGFGKHHAEQVRTEFQAAQTFISERARDNTREFFAEGVEAYLTGPSKGFDFRPDNHQEKLLEVHPSLARYLEATLASFPSQHWVSRPTPSPSLPPGTPDPDRDPIYLP